MQALIDWPMPGQQGTEQPVDTEPFRRELRQSVRIFGEWGDRTAEHTINSMADAARRFQDAGDRCSACAIYQAIIEESLLDDHCPVDDEGEFVMALNKVPEHLADCLEQDEIAQEV